MNIERSLTAIGHHSDRGTSLEMLPCDPVGIRWTGLKGTRRTEVMSLGPAGQGMFMVRYDTGFLSDAHDGRFPEARSTP